MNAPTQEGLTLDLEAAYHAVSDTFRARPRFAGVVP